MSMLTPEEEAKALGLARALLAMRDQRDEARAALEESDKTVERLQAELDRAWAVLGPPMDPSEGVGAMAERARNRMADMALFVAEARRKALEEAAAVLVQLGHGPIAYHIRTLISREKAGGAR